MSKRSYSQEPSFPKYENFFYGYCFLCEKIGHNVVKYRAYIRRNETRSQKINEVSNKFLNARTNISKNNNPFSLLFDVTKYSCCHNFGHKYYECQLINFKPQSQDNHRIEESMLWKNKKEEKETNKCSLVLDVHNQNNQRYVNNGYSKHMARDKSKFLTLNGNKFGNVTFDNDALGKIMGKGRVSLNNGRGKAHDVLFVVELKHKLLSVSQMYSR